MILKYIDMVDKLIILKRLAFIKYLYQMGVEQSKKPESIAAFSLLNFHDSIEMFLRLMVENKGKKESTSFMSHWIDYPDLTIGESMKRLNQLRVNFKHKGILPSKDDIEACKIYSRDFFYDNTLIQFGCSFESISLLELVKHEIVKDYLVKANSNKINKNYQKSLESSAFAFKELMNIFFKTKESNINQSFLPIDEKVDLLSRVSDYNNRFSGSKYSDAQERVGKDFRYLAANIEKAIDKIRFEFKILSLNIDYVKYSKFNMLVPELITYYREEKAEVYSWKDVEMNEEQCQFCIDFVIESAISIQNIDQDLSAISVLQTDR